MSGFSQEAFNEFMKTGWSYPKGSSDSSSKATIPKIESVTKVDGGNNVIFSWNESDGTAKTETMFVADGAKGDKGDTGADGYTPVKGTDYFTESEIDEIVQQVVDQVNSSTTD